ncbi:MAG: DUF1588 domain-containing protein [Myxococcota bacterium]
MRSLASIVSLTLSVGCHGTFDDGPMTAPRANPPPRQLSCDVAEETGAPVPLRRLTAAQLQASVSDVFGVSVEFEVADEELIGYRSNTTGSVNLPIARAFLDSAEAAAEEVSSTIASECTEQPTSHCADYVLDFFGRRLLRRSPSPEVRQRYRALFEDGTAQGDRRQGVQLVLEALLQSPYFLYQVESVDADGWLDGPSVASRLALALWGTVPDHAMLDAAESGELSTAEGIRHWTEYAMNDPRFHHGLEVFVLQWLELERLNEANERPDLAAQEAATREALQREPLTFFVQHLLQGSTVADLLSSSETSNEPALRSVYGSDILESTDGVVQLDPSRRVGILTLPGVQAALAHANSTAPSLRGRAILANLLCRPPPPPPPDVVPSLPPPVPGASVRQQLEAHFSEPSCAACHATMDGIGFAFEHYDWLGRFRSYDRHHRIDASGEFHLGADQVRVLDAVDLSYELSERVDVSECISRQFARYVLGVLETREAACTIRDMGEAARRAGGLREMVIELFVSEWFRRPG